MDLSIERKKQLVDPEHSQISIRRQCELLELSRASYYRQPAGESAENLEIMRLIDQEYTHRPFFGYRKMTVRLRQEYGYLINRKRVARLMRRLGLQAVYPRKRTTIANKEHKKYPYLLRTLTIERPNQVWAADITYVPMHPGFNVSDCHHGLV